MIDPHSYNSARFADLRRVLTGWLNDELAQYRIIVKSLEEDLYDGHVLQKLTGTAPRRRCVCCRHAAGGRWRE